MSIFLDMINDEFSNRKRLFNEIEAVDPDRDGDSADNAANNPTDEPEDYTQDTGDDDNTSNNPADAPEDYTVPDQSEDQTPEEADNNPPEEGTEADPQGGDDPEAGANAPPADDASGDAGEGEGGGDEGEDYTEGDGEGGDPGDGGGDDNYGDDGGDMSDDEIKQLEDELFSKFTSAQIVIMSRTLKKNYNELFIMLDDLVDRINDIPKVMEYIDIIEFISNKLSDLRDMVSDYLYYTFDTKSYTENEIAYKRFIIIANQIADLIGKIPSTKDANS